MPDYAPGDVIGQYTLHRRLGGGGFGDVWQAESPTHGRVALKLLSGKYSTDAANKLRTDVELLAASASASSPNVVQVLGGGTDPAPHVVMEYIEGTDLAVELEAAERLPVARVLPVARGVATALVVLLENGIIHRDIKPSNVMIDAVGVVKLTDFGIAKIVGFDTVTSTGQVPMTVAYAAPEVWEGKASHASDLYALGSLLFQCLTGQPPYTGSLAEIFRAHMMSQPDGALLPSDTPDALKQLILQCLAKEPASRPYDATVALDLVAQAEAQYAASLAPPPPPVMPRSSEPSRFGPWIRQASHAQPWSYLCMHEDTGEIATVDVHFTDDLSYGESLKAAVNAQLTTPDRLLLGTNRLVLRPDEAWESQPPPGRFLFWLARREWGRVAPAQTPAFAPPTPAPAPDRQQTQVQPRDAGPPPEEPEVIEGEEGTTVVLRRRARQDQSTVVGSPSQDVVVEIRRTWRDRFILEIRNNGTRPAELTFSGSDNASLLVFVIPSPVNLHPGVTATIEFLVKLLPGYLPRSMRAMPFSIATHITNPLPGASEPPPVSDEYYPIPITDRPQR